ncbi:MAG: hypothetical protein HC895_04290 [Leptolyngbyaceae cyanobacterium SM1_3_5]|nr:hypothetical protein [Leptolyngbyaceae cyanobacterium SM1_3_5]
MAAKRKPEFRVFCDDSTAALIRTLAALKNISISELFNESMELYLSQDEIQRLIDRHNLDEIETKD